MIRNSRYGYFFINTYHTLDYYRQLTTLILLTHDLQQRDKIHFSTHFKLDVAACLSACRNELFETGFFYSSG